MVVPRRSRHATVMSPAAQLKWRLTVAVFAAAIGSWAATAIDTRPLDGDELKTPAASRSVKIKWDGMNGRFDVENKTDVELNTLAVGYLEQHINQSGWAFLNITTFPHGGRYLDYQQAYAAGLAEGYLTKDLIDMQWRNVYLDYCKDNMDYCSKLNSFLHENLKYMLEMVKLYSFTDPYWHQVGLVLVQLAGIESGYEQLPYYVYTGDNLTPNISLLTTRPHIMQLNLHGDLVDLERKFGKKQQNAPGAAAACSALVALTKDNADLLVGHTTWSNYNTMLRIHKKFILQYHKTFDSEQVIPGNVSVFSSYPGRLISGDDFYLLSTKLLVTETSLENNNKSLYVHTTPRGTVPSWVRNLVANRLASTPAEWAQIYARNNSGTYNNQWMIVDYKKFRSHQEIPNGTFHVLEQMPGVIRHGDMSWFLKKFGYWASYNTAYFPEIFNMSGQWELVRKYGDWFTYDKTPRALMFKRDHHNATSVEGLRMLLRYNNYKHDPLSRCKCTPPYSAENAIAGRSDLNPANGTYPFAALGHRPHGATDVKVINSTMINDFAMLIQSGPTYEDQPAFRWSDTDFKQVVRHEGHPDLFKFKPIFKK